jgi:soluble lytic murein transglycosylase-like protein
MGSTQMLPGTAQEMARKMGLPWRPDLLQSNDPSALDYQHRLGAAYLQEGFQKTGNVRDALRYYHGGPDRSMWGPKTNAYADAILSRLGGQ